MIKALLLVASGSAIGGIARFLTGYWMPKTGPSSFPLSTFLINIAGSFLIGIVFMLAEKNKMIAADAGLFLMTGICGGFTTFSALSLENYKLMQDGAYGMFIIYAVGSIIAGLFAIWAGVMVGKQFS